jgi:hypothetical protein
VFRIVMDPSGERDLIMLQLSWLPLHCLLLRRRLQGATSKQRRPEGALRHGRRLFLNPDPSPPTLGVGQLRLTTRAMDWLRYIETSLYVSVACIGLGVAAYFVKGGPHRRGLEPFAGYCAWLSLAVLLTCLVAYFWPSLILPAGQWFSPWGMVTGPIGAVVGLMGFLAFAFGRRRTVPISYRLAALNAAIVVFLAAILILALPLIERVEPHSYLMQCRTLPEGAFFPNMRACDRAMHERAEDCSCSPRYPWVRFILLIVAIVLVAVIGSKALRGSRKLRLALVNVSVALGAFAHSLYAMAEQGSWGIFLLPLIPVVIAVYCGIASASFIAATAGRAMPAAGAKGMATPDVS